MKKTIIFCLLTVILTTACQTSFSIPRDTVIITDTDPLYPVREHIETLVGGGKTPSIAVAVARDNEIIWEEAFGFTNLEEKIRATEHTPYPLASISKPLTATGLMILVERGLINLENPIDDYLGDAKLQVRIGDPTQATVRRIASHTAGLPLHSQHFYDGEPYQPPVMDETIHRYGNIVTAPGERFQYSNLGYGILSYIIPRLSYKSTDNGISYADFMRKEVFVPLGMDDTSVHNGAGNAEETAVKYTSGRLFVPSCISDSPGASDIYSSIHDLIRFAMFHLKNKLPYQEPIIKSTSIDEMQLADPATGPIKTWHHEGSGYGLGWYIGVSQDGLRVVYHDGGTMGVSTALALVPDENIAVAVLSNTDSPWADTILIEILCTLLSRDVEDFLPQVDIPQVNLNPELVGSWQGFVHTREGKIPVKLEIEESGLIYTTMAKQLSATPLVDVSYQNNFVMFNNAGGGPFLRGRMSGYIETADVIRGQPTKLWLELKLRDNVLNGALIAFSQRTFYTGPLSHWVEMVKE